MLPEATSCAFGDRNSDLTPPLPPHQNLHMMHEQTAASILKMDPISIITTVFSIATTLKTWLDNHKDKQEEICHVVNTVTCICDILAPFNHHNINKKNVHAPLLNAIRGLGDMLHSTQEHLLVWENGTMKRFVAFVSPSSVTAQLQDDERRLDLWFRCPSSLKRKRNGLQVEQSIDSGAFRHEHPRLFSKSRCRRARHRFLCFGLHCQSRYQSILARLYWKQGNHFRSCTLYGQ